MHPSGPSNARIMIVGEAPGEYEIMRGEPFIGPSGEELNRMLHEAGISRSECFITNVCNQRPPANDMEQWLSFNKQMPKPSKKMRNTNWVRFKDVWVHPAVEDGYKQLAKHIELVKPTLILALGNTSLWALTGKKGIKKWRGSELWGGLGGHECKVIPAYHPAAVLRQWATRPITVHDFRRAAREAKTERYVTGNYDRIIRPNYGQAIEWLGKAFALLEQGSVYGSTDIETRAGHTACTGIYIKGLPTISIPWMCVERPEGYWTADKEVVLWHQVRRLLTHPNFKIIGQNWIYDSQYKYRFFFIKTLPYWDTMIAQHCMYPGTPKGLDYLASLYCEHYVYWKDDGKTWDPNTPEDDLWNYNCEDCERTYEVFERQREVIQADERLSRVWDFQTNTLGPLLLKAMFRGIRANVRDKKRLSGELDTEIKVREAWIQDVVGHPLNFKSPLQVRSFFYEDLKQKPIKKRGTGELTVDDEALSTIAKRNPLLRPLCKKIQELRSLGVFKSTFVDARLDKDQRIRCSFNIGGTVTFRLSSSENAFGSGLNLQNIPAGSEDEEDLDKIKLPNIRKLFIPDEAQTIFDVDLRNADFYTVVWEADDDLFRLALERGLDMHLLNAGTIFGIKELNEDKLLDEDFDKWAKKHFFKQRDFSKKWVHGTDFGGGDRTMAATAGITVRENERYRLKWFGEHPGIKAWHDRTEQQLKTHRYVENRFGYRVYFFDRVEGLLPEALAWVPQSTTGCVINRIWARLDKELPQAEVLLQVHDSLTGQYPTDLHESMRTRIPEVAKVVVPYDRPLVIPIRLKTSPISWGHCE